MIPSTYGDMSRHLSLSRHSARLKSDISGLSKEMTTGLVGDKARHLNGNLSFLAGLEQSIELAAARKSIAQNSGNLLATQQSALAGISARSEGVYLDLLQMPPGENYAQLDRQINALETAFVDTVQLLNTSFAGRSLFGGVAGDRPALAPAQDILQALAADLSLGLDAAGMSAEIDAWFAAGGGFDSVGYLGGDAVPEALNLGDGLEISFEITAQSLPIRQTLAGLAKGALLATGVFDSAPAEKLDALRAAASTLEASNTGLINLSAQVGVQEERAARGVSAVEAEQTAMSIARTELVSADPYETATKLEQATSQLELIYSLTARLSRLTLADYLR